MERNFTGNMCTAKNVLWYVKEYYSNKYKEDDEVDIWKTEYRIIRSKV